MHYLIRWVGTKEVAGIRSTEAVLSDVDFAKALSACIESNAKPPLTITGDLREIRNWLIQIVGWNLKRSQVCWYWEPISQAEYETYRDLHEFRVMKRYG